MSCVSSRIEKGKIIGLDFTKDEINYARQNNQILSLDLELSHRCNLRCVYCFAESGPALKDEITLEEIKDVIDQALDLGLKKVSIVGGGEPLMYPDFFKVTGYIKEKGLDQIVFTNGTLITEEVAEKLKADRISVVMKLNSFDPQTQDFLTEGKNVLKRIMTGYENLCQVGYLDDEELTLGVESVICKQNIGELPKIWRWARERRITPYFEILTVQGRARNYDLLVPIAEVKVLFEDLLAIDQEFGYNWTPIPPIAGQTCQRNYYAILLTSLGKIQPCTGISIEIGDIRKSSLKEIVESSEVLAQLRKMPETLKGPCGSCEKNVDCYGCRGSAYNLTGDYLASDPLCWHNECDLEVTNSVLAQQAR